jgi:hypothetical protein
MKTIINFVKKPIVWIIGLIILAIGATATWLFSKK